MQVDWIPCGRRANRWRLMMQARTKVFGMRCVTGKRCMADMGHSEITQRGRCLPRMMPSGAV